MSQQELLKRVVEILDQLGIDYMVTGSTASSLQGLPRSTHDIDLVVVLLPASAKALAAAFATDYRLLATAKSRPPSVRATLVEMLDSCGQSRPGSLDGTATCVLGGGVGKWCPVRNLRGGLQKHLWFVTR